MTRIAIRWAVLATVIAFAVPLAIAGTAAAASAAPGTGVTSDSVASPERIVTRAASERAAAASLKLLCSASTKGTVETAPALVSLLGVGGTTSTDLAEFATAYNAIRVAHCLEPFPLADFHYSACIEQRLFWMAEDPSTDPASAWGHMGTSRSDSLPSVGCDGNLAGGSDDASAIVAQKWWDSPTHRESLYRPGTPIDGGCIFFAMTHGGIPNEGPDFVRASARWLPCP